MLGIGVEKVTVYRPVAALLTLLMLYEETIAPVLLKNTHAFGVAFHTFTSRLLKLARSAFHAVAVSQDPAETSRAEGLVHTLFMRAYPTERMPTVRKNITQEIKPFFTEDITGICI